VKDTGAFKAIGTVTFMNSGKPEQVVLELLRSGNNWRIADVTWESGTLRALYRGHAARDSESVPREQWSGEVADFVRVASSGTWPPSFSMKLFMLARPRSGSVP
jgi:hypothetical protein